MARLTACFQSQDEDVQNFRAEFSREFWYKFSIYSRDIALAFAILRKHLQVFDDRIRDLLSGEPGTIGGCN